MRTGWLTIDDTPSRQSDVLLDYLRDKSIQTLFFCRGDLAAENPAPVIRAIREGHIIGSHGYTHVHASTLGLDAARQSITRSKQILDALHEKAGVERRCVYFRFPHVDRGMGSWLVNPADCNDAINAQQKDLIAGGIRGASFDPPSPSAVALKDALQAHLKALGFQPNPFAVLYPFIRDTELATAYDVNFTFSTADWQITERHRGKWGMNTLDDLKCRMEADADLQRTDTPHIILSHDQDETVPTAIALVQHLLDKGFEFRHIL